MISDICPLGLTDEELSRWHDDDLSPARTAQIRTHAATCTHCRERLAAYEDIGVGLRALQPPPLDLERLMASLREASPSAPPSPAHLALPRHLPSRTQRRSWRRVTGAAGLAAVLVISLLAGVIFATHGRPLTSETTRTGTPLLIPIEDMPLEAMAIAMSSPTDGWAFGSKSNGGDTPVIALHYTAGRWLRVQTAVQGQFNDLKMLSPTDGWLVGDRIYHFDGRSWQAVTVPRQDTYDVYEQIAAISPSAIWITVDQGSKPAILHYDGKSWTKQDLPTPAPLHLQDYKLSGIAMVSETEGWTVGTTYYVPPNDPTSSNMTAIGVVLHYSGGAWTVARTCQQCELATVSAASAASVWIGGDYLVLRRPPNPASLKPLLWQLNSGVWQDAPIPNPKGYSALAGSIGTIQMLSATEGWMSASIAPASPDNRPSNLPPEYIPLYRLQNGQWAEVSFSSIPVPYNGYVFAFVSPDEFWAMGPNGISHYYKGEWKNIVA